MNIEKLHLRGLDNYHYLDKSKNSLKGIDKVMGKHRDQCVQCIVFPFQIPVILKKLPVQVFKPFVFGIE